MKIGIKNKRGALAFLALVAINLLAPAVLAQSSAFTYQGRLNAAGGPANGFYDLRFAVYDAGVAGHFIAGPVTNSTVVVSNGLFTVTLDFGAGVFTGTNYWVEMGVRTNSGGSFSTLAPRQPLTPAPYALNALTLAAPQANALCPAGSVMAFAGATPPSGWLPCNGTNVSRTTYSNLFLVISIAYGVGDGSTTFTLPDMRGRAGIGAGQGPSLSNRSLGQTLGEETHTLNESEIPSHFHSVNLTTSTAGAHTHTFPIGPGDAGARDKAADGDQAATGNPSTSSAGNHSHSVIGNTGSKGDDGAHNNMQPSLALNYIIKY